VGVITTIVYIFNKNDDDENAISKILCFVTFYKEFYTRKQTLKSGDLPLRKTGEKQLRKIDDFKFAIYNNRQG